jgi:hypothetical protein
MSMNWQFPVIFPETYSKVQDLLKVWWLSVLICMFCNYIWTSILDIYLGYPNLDRETKYIIEEFVVHAIDVKGTKTVEEFEENFCSTYPKC